MTRTYFNLRVPKIFLILFIGFAWQGFDVRVTKGMSECARMFLHSSMSDWANASYNTCHKPRQSQSMMVLVPLKWLFKKGEKKPAAQKAAEREQWEHVREQLWRQQSQWRRKGRRSWDSPEACDESQGEGYLKKVLEEDTKRMEENLEEPAAVWGHEFLYSKCKWLMLYNKSLLGCGQLKCIQNEKYALLNRWKITPGFNKHIGCRLEISSCNWKSTKKVNVHIIILFIKYTSLPRLILYQENTEEF